VGLPQDILILQAAERPHRLKTYQGRREDLYEK